MAHHIAVQVAAWRYLCILAAAAWAFLPSSAQASNTPFGWHEHDGFYMRFSTGPSLLDVERNTSREGSGTAIEYQGDASTIDGVALATELSVGGTPVDRLVVSGTLLTHVLPNAVLTLADGSSAPLDDFLHFLVLAPTVSVYPTSTGGFHFGVGAGYARVGARAPGPTFDGIGGNGIGATLSAGHDFWVDDDLSVGLLGRATAAVLSGEQRQDGIFGSEDDTVTAIGLNVSAVYH